MSLKYTKILFPVLIVFIAFGIQSCNKNALGEDYTAYFGGEIINPKEKFVLLLKDNKVIDSLLLDKDNRFFMKYDSLTPGLYTFSHAPEYQYLYFEKNDSLMIRLNTNDFDNTLSFCGRGDEKNNFLIEMYLENESDDGDLFDALDKNITGFTTNIDTTYQNRTTFYTKKKKQINWSENFDKLAKASVDFHYFYKKELYPYAHEYKTGENICKTLPKDYYSYRDNIDFNDTKFVNFAPFLKYVTVLLNNITFEKSNCKINALSIDNHLTKLNITDTLFKNEKIKNVILNNIAYSYLLDEENVANSQVFMNRFLKLSTCKDNNDQIISICTSIENLRSGKFLSNIALENTKSESVDFKKITNNKETVIFFWSNKAVSHLKAVHDKVRLLKQKHPNVNFVAININDTKEEWLANLKSNDIAFIPQYKSVDFQEVKNKWFVYKAQRTIILNADGTIKEGFSNLFKADFEKHL
jgi:hypothetical protein